MARVKFFEFEAETSLEVAAQIHERILAILEEFNLTDVPFGFVEVTEEEASNGEENEAS